MRRVVVTGMGVVSSIGNDAGEALAALRQGRSGLAFSPEMAELGFRCAVYAPVRDWKPEGISRKALQTMTPTAQYATGAALEALADAGLTAQDVRNERTGAIVGTAFGGLHEATRTEQILLTRKSPSRAGGTGIVKAMNSSASGNIATYLGIRGRAYSVSSSFASGVDNIGHAYELIRDGRQDVCFCGAAEEESWRAAGAALEAARALPHESNDRPAAVCRPYDRDRQGLVLSEGAGILVLEALEHAARRGARVHAEVVGYGSANDGADMFRPTGEGLLLAMRAALATAADHGIGKDDIDYVNSHATGTRLGDAAEAGVLRELFGPAPVGPWVSSTKGHTGHGMGAAGALEAAYTLLMLGHGFLAPTANLDHVDSACAGLRHVRVLQEVRITTALSFSAGFGGANAAIIFRAPGSADRSAGRN